MNPSSVNEHFTGIVLEDTGKRFNRDWIFKHIHYRFDRNTSYAITGPNGSGKSTLLQAIAGNLHLSEGSVTFSAEGQAPPADKFYLYLSIAAPYLELVEEMTANEFLKFHASFKPFITGTSIAEITGIVGLSQAADRQIRYYSSGMKQRLKLAQAIFSDVPVVLLDEPCTNLDRAGYDLYHSLIDNWCRQRLVIVSSNDEAEIGFCSHRIDIRDYK